jgi:enamine deaminase RidA (YjgF/YER057c/UK114 family)
MTSPHITKTNPSRLHVPVDNLYSHVTSVRGGTLHRIGGEVSVDDAGKNIHVGDMAGQIRWVYEQVTIALEAVGASWRDVVHIYTFTTDMDTYLEEERRIAPDFFGGEPPSSTLIEVSRLVERDWLVEVQVDAVTQ